MSKEILRIEADGNTSNIYLNGKKINYVEEIEFRHKGGESTELKLKICPMKDDIVEELSKLNKARVIK